MAASFKGWKAWLIAGVLALMLLGPTTLAQARQVPYSQFVSDVQKGQVYHVRITGQTVQAAYRDGSTAQVVLPTWDARLPTTMIQYGVKVEYAEPQGRHLLRFVIRLLPPLLILVGILWITRRQAEQGSGLLSVEQSPAQLYRPGANAITMQDVAGLDEVKAELQEVVDFLAEPGRYQSLGARIPRGILLSGPPGTGKTLLARAVAGEAGVPFLSAAGSDFVEMFAGTGAARVRALFAKARAAAPCILFIDEIDALARQRGGGSGGGAEERDQTINQLLVEMDGFDTAEGIIVMAATNRPDILDAAIRRPGRFDRQLLIDPPDRRGREQILAVHARSKPLAPDVELAEVAALTPGYTGADLANLLNEAALLAVRLGRQQISPEEVRSALERVEAGGPIRRVTYARDERFLTACHEAGHALVGRSIRGPGSVTRISILPRGRSMGQVLFRTGEDRHLHGRRELEDRLVELMAGRAAEELLLGESSTRAADQLERATRLARQMVVKWGMHPAVGPINAAESESGIGEEAQRAIDQAIRELVAAALGRARGLLYQQLDGLHRLVEALLSQERLEGTEVERLLAGEAAAL